MRASGHGLDCLDDRTAPVILTGGGLVDLYLAPVGVAVFPESIMATQSTFGHPRVQVFCHRPS